MKEYLPRSPLTPFIVFHHLVPDKEVSLEMYPLPAVVGENVILRCLVWGTDQISNTVFYKNKAVISNTHSSQHVITNVTESSLGKYKCQVIYTHVARTGGPPYIKTSDPQELLFEGIKCLLLAFYSNFVLISNGQLFFQNILSKLLCMKTRACHVIVHCVPLVTSTNGTTRMVSDGNVWVWHQNLAALMHVEVFGRREGPFSAAPTSVSF